MPNSNYRRGVRLERLWMAQMQRKGYTVMRSAGSKGKIDCVAWNGEEVIFAQLKNGKAAYSSKDVEALKEMARPLGVRVILVERVGAGGVEWKVIEC